MTTENSPIDQSIEAASDGTDRKNVYVLFLRRDKRYIELDRALLAIVPLWEAEVGALKAGPTLGVWLAREACMYGWVALSILLSCWPDMLNSKSFCCPPHGISAFYHNTAVAMHTRKNGWSTLWYAHTQNNQSPQRNNLLDFPHCPWLIRMYVCRRSARRKPGGFGIIRLPSLS